MKNIFERIRRAALPFQDKRDDEGHAETVVEFAEILCKLANADRDIVIPAAILHDIGWSRVPKKEALMIFPKDIPEEEKTRIKKMHEKEGVLLARQILSKENYDAKKIEEILEIVSGHDTRKGFLSENDGIVRDADKLWRFSKSGFWADIKRGSGTKAERYGKLKAMINEPDFFYSQTARVIAETELEKRNNEKNPYEK